MFEIKKGHSEYEYKSLRLPKELINQVQELANINEVSFNSIVIQCIEYALSSMEDPNNDKQNQ